MTPQDDLSALELDKPNPASLNDVPFNILFKSNMKTIVQTGKGPKDALQRICLKNTKIIEVPRTQADVMVSRVYGQRKSEHFYKIIVSK